MLRFLISIDPDNQMLIVFLLKLEEHKFHDAIFVTRSGAGELAYFVLNYILFTAVLITILLMPMRSVWGAIRSYAISDIL